MFSLSTTFYGKKSLASVKAEFCRHLWLSFQSKFPDIKFGEGQRVILLRNRSQDAFLSPGVPAWNALPCHFKNLLFNGPLIEETCKNNFKKNNFFVKWLTSKFILGTKHDKVWIFLFPYLTLVCVCEINNSILWNNGDFWFEVFCLLFFSPSQSMTLVCHGQNLHFLWLKFFCANILFVYFLCVVYFDQLSVAVHTQKLV